MHITRLTAGSRFAVRSISKQPDEDPCMFDEECFEALVQVWKEHSGIFDVK